MTDLAEGERRPAQTGLTPALFALAGSAVLLGNLWLARVHGGAVQATLVLGLLLLTVPGAAVAGLGLSAHGLARRRVGVGRGRDAGSAIKIGMILVIVAGVLLALLGLQLSHGPLTRLFPVPQAGALFFYRAGTALPALGALAILSAGLLLVDRPWVLLPGLGIAVGVDLWLAGRWLHRGASDVGFELAGMGLALPVALLLAATAAGGLLLASDRGRKELAVHLARPFRMADAGAILREAPWNLAAPPLAALWICLLFVAMAGGEARGDLVGPLMGWLACLTAVVIALEWTGRAGAGWDVGRLLLAGILAGVGLLLVALPSVLMFPLVPGLRHGDASLLAARILGTLALVELAFHLAARSGWLVPGRSPRFEWAICGGLSALVAIGLLATGRHGAVPLLMSLLLIRAAAIPVLRR